MDYLTRSIEAALSMLLAELPAVLIVGPRAAGKTTTARRYARTSVHLDRPAEAVAFRADPDSALRGLDEPILLDEWQVVPDVLAAVKRAVDSDPRPGRFLLTGSVRADIEAATWAGTGRLVRLPMYGMTIAEQLGRPTDPPLLDRLSDGEGLDTPTDPPDLRGYIDLALRGGFPEAALDLSERSRVRWIESYVDQLLTRDVKEMAGARDPMLLRRYFEAYALNSAGIVEDRTLLEAAGVNRKTALAYERLLENLVVAESLPSWSSNRLKRLVRSPKRYVVDPALMAGVIRVDAGAVMRDGDLLGRTIDTFVLSQIRATVPIAESRPRLYHLRTREGRHEVDLIAELGGRRLVAIEVKADAAPDREAARHLAWLRDELGERFVRGVVLHTGTRTFEMGERIIAAPICTLWG
jgi:predicted AAA+ superfamily ATPase